jgi:hypothetical protein
MDNHVLHEMDKCLKDKFPETTFVLVALDNNSKAVGASMNILIGSDVAGSSVTGLHSALTTAADHVIDEVIKQSLEYRMSLGEAKNVPDSISVKEIVSSLLIAAEAALKATSQEQRNKILRCPDTSKLCKKALEVDTDDVIVKRSLRHIVSGLQLIQNTKVINDVIILLHSVSHRLG